MSPFGIYEIGSSAHPLGHKRLDSIRYVLDSNICYCESGGKCLLLLKSGCRKTTTAPSACLDGPAANKRARPCCEARSGCFSARVSRNSRLRPSRPMRAWGRPPRARGGGGEGHAVSLVAGQGRSGG